jgi:mRNA interferase MazF
VTFAPSKGTEIRKTRPALIISSTVVNQRRSKVTVLPFTSIKVNDSRVASTLVTVPASSENGLVVDSLLVCIDPMTFDKSRLIKRLGDLETQLLQQARVILRQYLDLN